jgi:hypothetical protein
MRELLDFDKDELILQDESSGDDEEMRTVNVSENFKAHTVTVAEATEIVKSLESGV